jgi:hypothetical protein
MVYLEGKVMFFKSKKQKVVGLKLIYIFVQQEKLTV